MRVASFETKAVRVDRPYGPSRPDTVDFVTVTLRSPDGVEGIGYAGFAATMLTPALKATVDALCEQTVGADPMAPEATVHRLLAMAGGGSPAGLVTRAMSAIDVALWDLQGKLLGQPVHKLLGGYRDRVPCYASGELWRYFDLDALAEAGLRLAGQGYRAMKFRMGAEPTVAKELERARVLREAVGSDVDLMVDINQGWDVNRAITVGRHLTDYGLYWLEDPTQFEDYAGLARIADALDTPIAAGEYVYGLTPVRHLIEHRSVDIVMVDLLRVGGLTQWMKAAHLAQTFNLPIVSHLAPEILAHAVAAVPNGLTVEIMPWAYPLFEEVPQIDADGMLPLPSKPGLGLAFDADTLVRAELR